MDIFESLENLEVSERCFKDIVSIIEEIIDEVSKEDADAVSLQRYINRKEAKDKYDKTKDSKDEEKLEKENTRSYKNSKLRDKWDILKGIKKGKDGKFHSPEDYKEYKGKHEEDK